MNSQRRHDDSDDDSNDDDDRGYSDVDFRRGQGKCKSQFFYKFFRPSLFKFRLI